MVKTASAHHEKPSPGQASRGEPAHGVPARGAPLRRPAHIRALIAPTRQEIVDALESAGPSSIARLADLLGRRPDGLYHHIRHLERVGLVKEVERQQEGRHVFAVYDLVTRPMRLDYDGTSSKADLVKVVSAAQRLSLREFQDAIVAGESIGVGPARRVWGARARGWLTPDQLARVNALLAEALDVVGSGRPRPGAKPMGVSFLLTPSPPGERRSTKTRSRAGAKTSTKGARR